MTEVGADTGPRLGVKASIPGCLHRNCQVPECQGKHAVVLSQFCLSAATIDGIEAVKRVAGPDPMKRVEPQRGPPHANENPGPADITLDASGPFLSTRRFILRGPLLTRLGLRKRFFDD